MSPLTEPCNEGLRWLLVSERLKGGVSLLMFECEQRVKVLHCAAFFLTSQINVAAIRNPDSRLSPRSDMMERGGTLLVLLKEPKQEK